MRAECERALRAGDFASWTALASACGYDKPTGQGDVVRLKRILGMTSRAGRTQSRIQEKTALRIINALGLDPVDIGL